MYHLLFRWLMENAAGLPFGFVCVYCPSRPSFCSSFWMPITARRLLLLDHISIISAAIEDKWITFKGSFKEWHAKKKKCLKRSLERDDTFDCVTSTQRSCRVYCHVLCHPCHENNVLMQQLKIHSSLRQALSISQCLSNGKKRWCMFVLGRWQVSNRWDSTELTLIQRHRLAIG